MKGTSVTWVPGLDHAGIATQAVLEKHLSKTKNLTRKNTNTDELIALMSDWKEEKSHKIREQLRQMGSSLDWSKEYFTMSKVIQNSPQKCHVLNQCLLQISDS